MKTSTLPFTLSAALLLAGCTGVSGVTPNQTSMVQVRAKAGSPTAIRFDRNGDELWEYATGPAGFETNVVRFAANGQVKEITQILTQERLFSIDAGKSTKADVLQILGRPSDQSFPHTGTVWSWRFRDGAQLGYLAVSFNPDGTVKERMMLLDPSGDGRSGGRDQ